MYFTDLCYAVELEQYLWDYFGKFSFVLLSLLVGNRITRYTVANTQILLLYVIFVVQIAYTDNLIVTIMNNCQFWTVTIELDILPDIESHKPWYYLGVNSIKYFHLTASSWIHVISILHCGWSSIFASTSLQKLLFYTIILSLFLRELAIVHQLIVLYTNY